MRPTLPLLAVVCAALGGCQTHLHTEGPGETCAAVMQQAFPSGEITVTKTKVTTPALAAVIVALEGTRAGLVPAPGVARDVAVECRFDHDVLTDFHWTAPPFR